MEDTHFLLLLAYLFGIVCPKSAETSALGPLQFINFTMIEQMQGFSGVSISFGDDLIHNSVFVQNCAIVGTAINERFDNLFHLSFSISFHFDDHNVAKFAQGFLGGILAEKIERTINFAVKDEYVFVFVSGFAYLLVYTLSESLIFPCVFIATLAQRNRELVENRDCIVCCVEV